MRKNRKVIIFILFTALFAIGLSQWVRREKDVVTTGDKREVHSDIIVIDAGHGGFDPGKVGVNQAVEKDINLSIALKLKELLKTEGYEIVMTRETDEALREQGNDKGSKQEDMRKRVELINNSNAVAAVSIHQNSFTESSSHGAQVFYHPISEEAKKLALILQAKIKEEIQDGNHREAKANESYYMLKKTTCPLVIVECGFLSNPEEAEKLVTDEYQNQIAEAVKKGLLEYLQSDIMTTAIDRLY